MVFEKNLTVLLESIEDCLANRRLLPCLILIYSSIDIVSSLEPGRATGSAFMAWTDKYLLKAISLPCTPSDLWGARCGICIPSVASLTCLKETRTSDRLCVGER